MLHRMQSVLRLTLLLLLPLWFAAASRAAPDQEQEIRRSIEIFKKNYSDEGQAAIGRLVEIGKPAGPAQPQAQAPSPIPAGPGGLAFRRDDSIYYLPPAVKLPIRLRPGRSGALSPDGRRLVFRMERPKHEAAGDVAGSLGFGLAVREIATGQETLILQAEGEEFLRAPVWSPAGDRLAFVAHTGLKVQLNLIQTDGFGRRALFSQGDENTFGNIDGLVWGPDGKSLWFHNNHELFQVSDTGALLAKTPLVTTMGKAQPMWVSLSVVRIGLFLIRPTRN